WVEVRPRVNPLVQRAIGKTALISYAMGSFYTSLVANMLVDGIGQAIRETKRPKVFVVNLTQDEETHGMCASDMLKELYRYLCMSDTRPGPITDYVNYALVGTHGNSNEGGQIPVDIEGLRKMGVEPILLPVETKRDGLIVHDMELVAAVLISLC
ncbi:MAG: 2-phospho-L-lactate transferase CofD family protein, partial [Pseudomonadota bacterium]